MHRNPLSQFREDMQLHGLGLLTQEAYQRCVRKFLDYIDKPLSKIGPQDTKANLLHLDRDLGRSVSTRNQYAAAFRFLFCETLGKQWGREKIPNGRAPKKLPVVISDSQFIELMRCFESPVHKTLALVCYGAGLRVSEAVSLRVEDIDSERGVIHVRRGKGNKQRQVTLSERLLMALRRYWLSCRPQGQYLFPGRGTGTHITRAAFCRYLRKTAKKAGIKKHITPHVLRHSYATFLIESGLDLRSVQLLLGHGCIQSTARYVHLTHARMQSIKGPLDVLAARLSRDRKRSQCKQQDKPEPVPKK